MNYYDAARIRKKGFANLMTDKLTSGQGIVSSLRGTLSDRSKAKSMAFKEKFDPLNIAKFLTGGSNLAPAILGRLTGRSKEDIGYFTGKKQYQYTPRTGNYWEKYNNPNMGGSRRATQVLEKIVSFMEKSREDDIKEQDTLDTYSELNEHMKYDNHKEVMDVFKEAIKNKRKAMKEMAKEAKKRQAQEKAKEKAEKKKEEVKKEAPKTKPEAPKPEAPKPKTEAPKPEAPKPEAPKTKPEAPKPKTEAPKPEAPKPEAPKPEAPKPEAPKPKTEAPKPEAPKPSAKQVETKPPAPPTATPAPPTVTPKPPPVVKPAITGAAKTAAKVGVGVAVGAAAAVAIKRIVEVGPGYNIVELQSGETVRQDGAWNWRNNNPGNIEYGDYALSKGAIPFAHGKNKPQTPSERFAIFPTYEIGRNAKAGLIFEGKNYKNLTIDDAIKRYAPPSENDTAGYQKAIKTALNLPEEKLKTLKMQDFGQEQRMLILDAMQKVEGYGSGKKQTKILSSRVNAPETGVKLNNGSNTNADMKKDMSRPTQSVAPMVNQNNITNKQRNITISSPPLQELNPRIGR